MCGCWLLDLIQISSSVIHNDDEDEMRILRSDWTSKLSWKKTSVKWSDIQSKCVWRVKSCWTPPLNLTLVTLTFLTQRNSFVAKTHVNAVHPEPGIRQPDRLHSMSLPFRARCCTSWRFFPLILIVISPTGQSLPAQMDKTCKVPFKQLINNK